MNVKGKIYKTYQIENNIRSFSFIDILVLAYKIPYKEINVPYIWYFFMDRKKSNRPPAVERALDVIELMVVSERDLSFSEIMKRINIPRQSLIRILNSLCDRGVVERTEKRGFYRVGMRFLYLGARLKDKITLRTVA